MDQQIAGHLSLDPPKPTSLKPDLLAGFDDVIARGMAKKPEERYQTTTELAAAARQALSPDTAGRTTPNYRRRHAAGRARAPGQARRCHPHRNPSAGRRHRCTGFADTRSDRHIAVFAGESSTDPLPFTRLAAPEGLAVNTVGDVYVADHGNNQVMKLAAGSSTPITMPFIGLKGPSSVAVDGAGGVYVADGDNHRVVKLAAGASTQTVLPFTSLNHSYGVAVDTAGSSYVTDRNTNRVLKRPPG